MFFFFFFFLLLFCPSLFVFPCTSVDENSYMLYLHHMLFTVPATQSASSSSDAPPLDTRFPLITNYEQNPIQQTFGSLERLHVVFKNHLASFICVFVHSAIDLMIMTSLAWHTTSTLPIVQESAALCSSQACILFFFLSRQA